jgi:hypothetical protein
VYWFSLHRHTVSIGLTQPTPTRIALESMSIQRPKCFGYRAPYHAATTMPERTRIAIIKFTCVAALVRATLRQSASSLNLNVQLSSKKNLDYGHILHFSRSGRAHHADVP